MQGRTGRAPARELTKRAGRDRRWCYPVVDGQAVAEVVSGWTGIPVGKMVRDEIKTVLALKDRLDERVVGQDHALEAIAQRIRTARADLADPRRPHRRVPARRPVAASARPRRPWPWPTSSTAATATWSSSTCREYKESHKVSQLIGSPQGYVGYGEGGVLTEAVRRRPYSRRAARRGREGPRERAGDLLPGVRQGHAAGRQTATR